MKDNEWDSIEEMQETLNKCEKEYFDIQNQLAEKEKERELDNSFWKQECDSLQKTLAEKEKEIEYQENMKILAVENQNKKAIERLEKVKELLLEKCGETYSKTYCGIDEDIEEIIGNQINVLRNNKDGIH